MEENQSDNSDKNPPSITGDFSDSDSFVEDSSEKSPSSILENTNESCDSKHKKKQKESLIGSQNERLSEKHREKQIKKSAKKLRMIWPIKALIITLFMSFAFGIVSQLVVGGITKQNVIIAYVLILLIIILSIIADIVAVAATSCDVEPFLAMSARKVKGAKLAVKLCKNAGVVSSICGDIIGDICGIISGACGAAIVAVAAITSDIEQLIFSAVCSAIIAAVMITGKAFGKSFAIKNANKITFGLAKLLSVFAK